MLMQIDARRRLAFTLCIQRASTRAIQPTCRSCTTMESSAVAHVTLQLPRQQYINHLQYQDANKVGGVLMMLLVLESCVFTNACVLVHIYKLRRTDKHGYYDCVDHACMTRALVRLLQPPPPHHQAHMCTYTQSVHPFASSKALWLMSGMSRLCTGAPTHAVRWAPTRTMPLHMN